MGTSISKQNVDMIQSSVNETINKTLNEVNNSAECKSDLQQTMIINLDDIVMDGSSKFTAGQTAEVNMECFVDNQSELSSAVVRDLETTLSSESELSSILENAGLNIAQTNVMDTKIKVDQYIENKLLNEVENVINNSISVDQSASNTFIFNAGNITMSGEAEFNLSQSSVIDVIGNTISVNFVESIINETGTTVVEASTKSEQDAKNLGFGESLMQNTAFMIVCVIFVIIGFIVFIVYVSKTATDPNTGKNLAQGIQLASMVTPQGQGANALKSFGGGAKKLFNKTTLLSIILVFLLYVAYKLT
jgi:hypothetical protein